MKRAYFILVLVILTAGIFACEPEPKSLLLLPAGDTFVVTSDYATGGYAALDSSSLGVIPDTYIGRGMIHSDALARSFNGKVYVMNRRGRDNIQVLEPLLGLMTVGEFTTGPGSNPQDISIVNGKAYVTRYDAGQLWIMDPVIGALYGSIDLSGYAAPSAGGVPRMSWLYYDAGSHHLFVALERLGADWHPSDYSSVVVIDTDTDSVIQEIVLEWSGGTVEAKVPYSRFRYVPAAWWQPAVADGHDHLMISCVGEFGYFSQLDAGIVAIDLQDLACEEGYVMSEAGIGSEVTDFVVKSGTAGYAVTSDAQFHSQLVRFNPQSGNIDAVLRSDFEEHGYLSSLSLHSSGYLFVCDRNIFIPGVRVYDTNSNDLPLNGDLPLNVGLPPTQVEFIQ